MNNTVFELYRNNTYDLVQSLIIKFSDEATCNNKALEKLGVVVNSDPTTWRYYLNLNGEYHHTNVPMVVKSLDTQQEITLSKEILDEHPKTKLALRPGKWLFYEMFDKYPTQSVLLKGLLYPVDPSVAVNAPDGEILNWDTSLVEEQEHHFISELNKESKSIISRWHIDTHMSVGTLYSATFLIVYMKAMYDAVMSIRNNYVHTNEAHSYHMWRFLASHGKLERYRSYLTHSQVIWLYREVKYIVNNAGLDETLQTLIDNLLTPRGIRVFELGLIQDSTIVDSTFLEIERTPRNYHDSGMNDLTVLTARDVNSKLSARIGGDPEDVESDTAKVNEQVSNLLSTKTNIKALETFIPSEASPILDVEITHLLRQWGYLALTGRYMDNIEVLEYVSGKNIKLNVRHAYQLYLAMTKISQRIPLSKYGKFGIPAVITHGVPDFNHPLVSKELTDEFTVGMTIPALINSRADFYTYAMQQRDAIIKMDLWSQQQLTSDIEATFRALINSCHRNVELTLGDEGTSEEDWVRSINPDLMSYTPNEAKNFAIEILTKCCGLDTVSDYDKDSAKKALMQLIEELGSYHVRFIGNDTDESPFNARIEVPKVNDIIVSSLNRAMRFDLGYRYEAAKDVVFKEYIIPYFIEEVDVTSTSTSSGEIPIDYAYTPSVIKTQSVHALYTLPPLQVIEEEVPAQ